MEKWVLASRIKENRAGKPVEIPIAYPHPGGKPSKNIQEGEIKILQGVRKTFQLCQKGGKAGKGQELPEAAKAVLAGFPQFQHPLEKCLRKTEPRKIKGKKVAGEGYPEIYTDYPQSGIFGGQRRQPS